ncbi:hypothetical protein L596_006494 [Steinernema carpocapsae]|uniref:Uncharacterized protein n=1 Tax=Steinernema carpocapsae TaxID=34508 RepID=A0A4U8V9B2_STECR|nr:hypothetical protein L596_006494 [Steinernema carpocapsae]
MSRLPRQGRRGLNLRFLSRLIMAVVLVWFCIFGAALLEPVGAVNDTMLLEKNDAISLMANETTSLDEELQATTTVSTTTSTSTSPPTTLSPPHKTTESTSKGTEPALAANETTPISTSTPAASTGPQAPTSTQPRKIPTENIRRKPDHHPYNHHPKNLNRTHSANETVVATTPSSSGPVPPVPRNVIWLNDTVEDRINEAKLRAAAHLKAMNWSDARFEETINGPDPEYWTFAPGDNSFEEHILRYAGDL